MQHRFEFVAELSDGGHVHMMYKGDSSRMRKVREKIIRDLKRVYNIEPATVGNVYLKPIDKK